MSIQTDNFLVQNNYSRNKLNQLILVETLILNNVKNNLMKNSCKTKTVLANFLTNI